MKKIVVHTALGLSFGLAAPVLAQGDLPAPANKVVDFQKDIAPLFAEHCSKCHSDKKQKSDYRLDNRDDAINSGSEGAAIVVGDSASSLIVRLLTGTDPNFDIMPPKGEPFTPEQIGLVRAWIDQGAVWGDAAAPDAGKTPFAGLGDQWFVDATAPAGPLATWELSSEKGPGGEDCVALVKAGDAAGNLLYDTATPFLNGRIETSLKATSGAKAQGGGIVWRVQDGENYFAAGINPAEKKVEVYTVKEGAISVVGSAAIDVAEGAWTTLAVEQQANHIKVSVDGKVLVEVDSDAFGQAGGYGLWTKADAVTVFTKPVVQAG